MGGNKAFKRAAKTKDAYRTIEDIPLIVDTTELITPKKAQDILKKNKSNRPISWKRVEEYAEMMANGSWKLHSQGIILDEKGNLLTGQKRLWAIVYSDTPVHMRISRGCPKDTENLIDRGTPQSARDLSSRKTRKKHSPTENSIARGILALRGNLKPSIDRMSEVIVENSEKADILLSATKGVKKRKSLVMIFSAICCLAEEVTSVSALAKKSVILSEALDVRLLPETGERCFNRGPAFTLALEHAKTIVKDGMG